MTQTLGLIRELVIVHLLFQSCPRPLTLLCSLSSIAHSDFACDTHHHHAHNLPSAVTNHTFRHRYPFLCFTRIGTLRSTSSLFRIFLIRELNRNNSVRLRTSFRWSSLSSNPKSNRPPALPL
ncbi:hypothetical protein GmHk_09G025636 [Glycine max]|nr:hypothetical protein GmHk_09G025636 [Glycine max]